MIDVVAGIILNDKNEVLIARRKEGKSLEGYFEFPGGKVEAGETEEESLIREIKEEINIDIEILEYFDTSIHRYNELNIKLIAYKCRTNVNPKKSTDHDLLKWVNVEDLVNYKISPADIPFVNKLIGK